MRVWLLAAGIIAVLGGGVALVAVQLAGDETTAAAFVPADALAYAHITLDPSLEQKRALLSLSKRLPDKTQEQLEKSIPKALDDLLGEADLDFEADIKPWLGGEAALFLGNSDDLEKPDFAALVETTDPEAALATVRGAVEAEGGKPEEQTHREVGYSVVPKRSRGEITTAYTVVGNFLVAGTPAAVTGVIDASTDGGLDGNASYSELVGLLVDDRLATYWADTPELVDLMLVEAPKDVASQFTSSPLFTQQSPSAGALLAADDAIVFESAADKPKEEGLFQAMPDDPALVGSLPGSTWLSLVIPGVGKNVVTLLDSMPDGIEVDAGEQELRKATGLDLREDILSWMQDGALFIGGDALRRLSGGIVIESSDPAATTTFVKAIADAGMEQGAPLRPTTVGELQGFVLADPSTPARATVVGGDRFILGMDAPEVRDDDSAVAALTGQGDRLEDNDVFIRATDALGADYAPVFYLDVNAALEVLRSVFGESSTPQEFTDAEPYVRTLSHVVAGTRDDGEHLLQRLVIGATE